MPNNPTDRELIEECRRLAKDATPGEWTTRELSGWALKNSYRGPHTAVVVPSQAIALTGPSNDGQSKHDAAFIAESRTSWPAMADRLERALAEIERLRVTDGFFDEMNGLLGYSGYSPEEKLKRIEAAWDAASKLINQEDTTHADA